MDPMIVIAVVAVDLEESEVCPAALIYQEMERPEQLVVKGVKAVQLKEVVFTTTRAA